MAATWRPRFRGRHLTFKQAQELGGVRKSEGIIGQDDEWPAFGSTPYSAGAKGGKLHPWHIMDEKEETE